MLRAVSLFLGLPAMVAVLLAAKLNGALSFVGTMLGIIAIISFAILAAEWTEDHDVSD